MEKACRALVSEFKPDFVYTQSDEITMVWGPKANPEAGFLFGGRYQKLTSILASFCSVNFYKATLTDLPQKELTTPAFDCRVWAVGSMAEVIDTVIWRYRDAIKNSISAMAQRYFSPKQLHGLNADQRLGLLLENGIDFNGVVEERSRSGVFFVSRPESTQLSVTELAKIPVVHHPTGPVIRSVIKPYYFGNEMALRVGLKLWLGGFDPGAEA
jgi:tRNA(His) 5'-end guanylyltransferase